MSTGGRPRDEVTDAGANELSLHRLRLGDSVRVQTRGGWVSAGTVAGATARVLILGADEDGDRPAAGRVRWDAIDTITVTPTSHPGLS